MVAPECVWRYRCALTVTDVGVREVCLRTDWAEVESVRAELAVRNDLKPFWRKARDALRANADIVKRTLARLYRQCSEPHSRASKDLGLE